MTWAFAASLAGKVMISSTLLLLSALLAPWAVGASDWLQPDPAQPIPRWGLRSGLQFAIHPAGFTDGEGGPRGLIRLGYPTLLDGSHDLINFIAIEPIVDGQRGFSELEWSTLDQTTGKRLWTAPADLLRSQAPDAAELRVTVFVERFENGAHVRLDLTQLIDAPNELRLTIHAEHDSAPIQTCILTATMGNKSRTRVLLLQNGPVSSLQLWPDYRDSHFTPHAEFALHQLPRAANGDVLIPIWNDEPDPAAIQPFGRAHFWDYRGSKVTQYWRNPAETVSPELACAVNGRYTYWMSQRPIPGGISFENFELRAPFQSGQTFIFGITRNPLPSSLQSNSPMRTSMPAPSPSGQIDN
jgi:hypothetical protein